MTYDTQYEKLLQTSLRVNWRLEDIIGNGIRMDFSRPFLPESFARTQALKFLTPDEQRVLNQIRAYGYLAMFELVERCILPCIDGHVEKTRDAGGFRTPALAQFAAEEAKHIELFVNFRREFEEDFGSECGMIGPAEDIGAAIRSHCPLGLAVFILAIEWATQCHYVESIHDDQMLDPQIKSLLKHHWLEESQHAKLDALVFYELAEKSSPEKITRAIDDFLDIGAFIDGGLKQQTELDLASFERATGRSLTDDQRAEFVAVQHQAMRWTFLGSAMRNKGFLEAIGSVSPAERARIEQVAPAFC